MTKDDFVKKSQNIHGDTYDYSQVEYTNNSTKVAINCLKHGIFWQKPNDHLMGHGCPKCGIEKNILARTKKQDNFVSEAKEIHGDTYDYSQVQYQGTHEKVCIICPKHGEFWQVAKTHLEGHGCPQCAKEKACNTTEQFINKAKTVHGEKYMYTNTQYKNVRTKVSILCPKHGEFWQLPINHLQGSNCPYCKMYALEEEIDRMLAQEGISFERQKRFDWLGRQSLDFYLPQYSIAIECQGRQHFEYVDFGNKGKELANNELMLTKERDKRKLEKCQEQGIKVLYFTNQRLGEKYGIMYKIEDLKKELKRD